MKSVQGTSTQATFRTALVCVLVLLGINWLLSSKAWNSQHMTATAGSHVHIEIHEHQPTPLTTGGQQQGQAASDIRLFVGVLSATKNIQARQAVRATWGADKRLARVMFFTLRPHNHEDFKELRQEAAQYRDLLITSEVYDGYYSITYAVLDLFKAAAAMGTGVTHVMKTDDDCFVRVSGLLNSLSGMPRQWLFAGWPMAAHKVSREPGWHQVPYDNWASDEPVRYSFGWGYVVSTDLAVHIAAGAPHMLMRPNNLLIIEDVAVGYWVQFIAREQQVAVHYNDSLVMGTQPCNSTNVVTHIKHEAPWKVLHCIHANQGGCCTLTRA